MYLESVLNKLSTHSRLKRQRVNILWGTYPLSLPHIVFLSKGTDRVKGKVRRTADSTNTLTIGFYCSSTDTSLASIFFLF